MSIMRGIFPKWVKDTPPAKVPITAFCDMVRNILETASGIKRPAGGGNGIGWDFGGGSTGSSGGIPAGYEEITGTIYFKEKMINGTFLVKTSGKVETNYSSTDARLLLQPVVHSSTVTLDLDKGYLKS